MFALIFVGLYRFDWTHRCVRFARHFWRFTTTNSDQPINLNPPPPMLGERCAVNISVLARSRAERKGREHAREFIPRTVKTDNTLAVGARPTLNRILSPRLRRGQTALPTFASRTRIGIGKRPLTHFPADPDSPAALKLHLARGIK